MSELDYEQYHQKGGTYVIPVEVFDELLEENQSLKKQLDGIREERDYLFNKLSTKNKWLTVENKKLKKQLENCFCNRTDCAGRIKDSKKYDSLVQKIENQQKEVIEKARNKLYEWGEALQPDFQKIMLDILKEVE